MTKNSKPFWLFILVALIISGGIFLLSDSSEKPVKAAKTEHSETEKPVSHEESAEIGDESAKTMGIETVVAAPAVIRETVRLSGRVVLNQNKSAEVKARFPGIVRSVLKQVGDTVRRGEKLATVESNESLQTYAVPSPLNGIVLERNVSVGDTAADIPVFVVADLSSVWAEFFVFAGDITSIHQGQTIIVRTLDGSANINSTLNTIQPTAEVSSQTVVARTEITNSGNIWRTGMTVQGDAVIKEAPVAIAVPTAAIQRMDDKEVVFVRNGSRYTAVPVITGLADPDMTEIKSGIAAGTEIVSKNSFVIKADIGKASAEHED